MSGPFRAVIFDLVEHWPQPRESYSGDLSALALQLDAFARRLVAQLPAPRRGKAKWEMGGGRGPISHGPFPASKGKGR